MVTEGFFGSDHGLDWIHFQIGTGFKDEDLMTQSELLNNHKIDAAKP